MPAAKVQMMRLRGLLQWPLFGSFLLGCTDTPLPKWPVSSPADLCKDRTLGHDDFCMPAADIERALKSETYEILAALETTDGITAPYKLRVRLPDGRVISAKFKRAPDDLDTFNNSPRREIAAYEMQKLFLDPPEYVVPPTVVTCLPVEQNRGTMADLAAHPGADCAIGVLAYWLENVTDEDVLDEDLWEKDAQYRHSLGNLNALTVLIGHQDDIGNNFLRSEDRRRPRLFAIDNGLAFGAMGVNPIQLVSSEWSDVRVEALPQKTVERLKKLSPAAFERFYVVSQLRLVDGRYLAVPPTEPIDKTEGARRRGDTIQLGLNAEELTDVNVRLVELLGRVGSGEVREDPDD
jgi:hypothetical protein